MLCRLHFVVVNPCFDACFRQAVSATWSFCVNDLEFCKIHSPFGLRAQEACPQRYGAWLERSLPTHAMNTKLW